jgi:hypothetical protein
MLLAVQQIFDPGSRRARPKEDRVVKSVWKSILVGVFLIMAAAFAAAQTFTPINPPPCDFSDQFYADNGLNSAATNPVVSSPELDTEPDGRFGNVINGVPVRLTGPPATGTQQNWVVDTTNCSAKDPTRRNVRILATTGGNQDDGNSPFSCADQNGKFSVPQCSGQANGIPETLEFISILAFIHAQGAFETQDSRIVGAINGGLDGVQQNDGETISINNSANPRGIRMQDIVGNFEAYANLNQFANTLQCPKGATLASQCTPAPGHFANAPCSLGMIQNLQNPNAHSLPQFCFNVADTQDSNGNTISDVATPKLRNNWRFATNRNAMDGSDGNCINNTDGQCSHINDAPFGYFCDDLLGMWIITYFWFTAPPNDAKCGPIYHNIGAGDPTQNPPVPGNGFGSDGFPIILSAHELNDELEANGCGAEGQQDPAGSDNGAAWLVCPAIPDPRNGAIASDAFLDVTTHGSLLDPFVSNNFTCLQQTGKFCFENSVE